MNIEHILWSNLVASPRNVRKVKAGITTLAASIATEGLLQNLAVVAREDGKYEVVAGERRRRAVAHLVKTKVWARDTTVPCLVRPAETATTTSFIENTERQEMHPADQIRAFADMAAQGFTEEAIANRYRYDAGEVRKMLALASLSPKIINALASDKIDVGMAQAFTLTDDHALQERVLRSARGAYDVRRQLTEQKIDTSDRRFLFVGAQAYEAAGGTLTRDLFAEEGDGYVDQELVTELAQAKLYEARQRAEAEGWGEVIAEERCPEESYRWHRLYPDEGEGYAADSMAKARLLMVIGRDGSLTRSVYQLAVQRMAEGGSTPLPRPLYTAQQTEDLSRFRSAAIALEVARHPRMALVVLLDALLPLVTGGGYSTDHAVQLRLGSLAVAPPLDRSTLPLPEPFDHLAHAMGAVPEEPQARFDHLLSLDDDTVQALLAACTGRLIDATQSKFAPAGRLRSADRIARALELDMRQHWEGSMEFYGSLSRKALLAALEEGRSAQAAENCLKLKKHDLASAALDRLSGTGWLPPALRTPDVDADAHADHHVDYDADNDDETVMMAAE